MIIDADCHISSHKWDALAITGDELVAWMDRAGVDKALTWLKPPYNKDLAPENRAVYDAMKRYPTRILGFGWVNPRLGKAVALDTITRCFEEYGFYGIKFNGAQDDYVIDDAAILPFIEKAAGSGKPIAFHIGADAYEQTHPYRLGAIAKRFPQTQFLNVHMGGAAWRTLDRASVDMALMYPNITLIGSGISELPVLRAVAALGAHLVCFGSDSPFRLMHVQRAAYDAMLRDHSDADRAMIMGDNIARLLGVS